MGYLAKIINEKTKQCIISEDKEYFRKQGFSELDVELSIKGNWYLRGFVPQNEDLAKEKRENRDKFLQDSDVYMLPDFPITTEEKNLWLLYRQYLRDITKDEKFPNIDILGFNDWKNRIDNSEEMNNNELLTV